MIILGAKLKEIRKSQKLNQTQLAEGICTQVTISNIENKNQVPNMRTLAKICNKLKIKIEDICVLEEDYTDLNTSFKEIDQLCNKSKHLEAYDSLSQIDTKSLTNERDKKRYNYYSGIISLIAFKDYEKALYYLNLGLLLNRNMKVTFTDILITNSIGIAYYKKGEPDSAAPYFEQSLKDIEEMTEFDEGEELKLIKVLYNTSKFYSGIGEFQKAIDLCNNAHEIITSLNTTYCADVIYYEKGYNLYRLDKSLYQEDISKLYFLALAYGITNRNNKLIETIQENLNNYDIQPFDYVADKLTIKEHVY